MKPQEIEQKSLVNIAGSFNKARSCIKYLLVPFDYKSGCPGKMFDRSQCPEIARFGLEGIFLLIRVFLSNPRKKKISVITVSIGYIEGAVAVMIKLNVVFTF